MYGFDNVPPTVGFTGFTPGSPSNSATVQISVQGIDSLSGVNRIDVLVDSAVIGTVSGSSGSVVWNAGGYAEGPHTIQAVAYDNAVPGGNPSQTESVTFTLDRTGPPTSATLSPASPDGQNGWYVTAPTLTLSSSDPSGIAYRRYRINGGPWQEYTAPVVINEQGTVLVEYFSRDNAGNDGPVGPLTLKIDTSPPPAPTLTDEGLKTPSQTLLQLAITGGVDPQSGIGRITYMVGNAPGNGQWRGATTVPAFGPFLVIEGLFIPPWENVVVSARVTNGAGVEGPWGNSDGIVVEPTAFEFFAISRLFGSAGGVGLHPDLVLEGSSGEPMVGESRFLPDVELLTGFWGEHDLLSMPKTYQLTFGEAVPGGHLFDAYFLDTRRLEAMERFDQETVVPVQWVFEADAPILEPSLLEIYVWSRADESGRGRRVELYDFNLQDWVPVHSSLMQASDELSRITVAVDPWRFVSFEQKVRARFSFEPIVSETSNRLRIGVNRVFWRFIRR